MSRRTALLSSTKFSRIQEKHELQNLNDRLAFYISRAKYLETKNSKLTQELRSSEEEIAEIKVLIKSEIEDLRNRLDREAKLKTHLELESMRKTLEELKTK